MILYYISDRRQFPGTEQQKRERLLAKVAEAARCGVDFIQLREKDLTARELLELARAALDAMRGVSSAKLLVNSRVDVALAAGADGVHLTSSDIPASDARVVAGELWDGGNFKRLFIGVSCHTAAEVKLAEAQGADFAVFAPVFEKVAAPQRSGVGLDALREACRAEGRPIGPEAVGASRMPVLALGGIAVENAGDCMMAGAAGIAAIRLFQGNDIQEVLRRLSLAPSPEEEGCGTQQF